MPSCRLHHVSGMNRGTTTTAGRDARIEKKKMGKIDWFNLRAPRRYIYCFPFDDDLSVAVTRRRPPHPLLSSARPLLTNEGASQKWKNPGKKGPRKLPLVCIFLPSLSQTQKESVCALGRLAASCMAQCQVGHSDGTCRLSCTLPPPPRSPLRPISTHSQKDTHSLSPLILHLRAPPTSLCPLSIPLRPPLLPTQSLRSARSILSLPLHRSVSCLVCTSPEPKRGLSPPIRSLAFESTADVLLALGRFDAPPRPGPFFFFSLLWASHEI